MSRLENDISCVLYTEQQLADMVKQLGARISEEYRDKNLFMVAVLKGSVVFMADLMRQITVPCTVDFLSVSSYGKGTTSSGQVRILKDLDTSLEGKDLLLVEDILDSGRTLRGVMQMFEAKHPNSVKICTLLDKPAGRVEAVEAAYAGFTVPDAFVVGYGLDYAGYYRNLPFVGVLKPSVYQD